MNKILKNGQAISNWGLFVRILSEAKAMNLTAIAKLLPFMFVYVGFIVSEPYFYKLFVDGINAVLSGNMPSEQAIGEFSKIGVLWGAFTIASLVTALLYRTKCWDISNREWEIGEKTILRKFFGLPYDYHVSTNLWERVMISERWPQAIAAILARFVETILPQSAIFIGLLGLGFWVNWKMMLVSLSFIPFVILISGTVGKRVHEKQKAVNEYWDKAHGRFGDALQNIALIKLFARQPAESRRIQTLNKTAIDKQLEISMLWGILDVGSGFLDFMVKVAVMITGAFFVLNGTIGIGDLFLFVALSGRLYAPLQMIESNYRDIVERLAKYDKMRLLLSMSDEPDTGTVPFAGFSKSIAYDAVSFAYPSNDREVISDVSLEIAKGERIAFVGHTGSGKTTLTQLLTRFYDPLSGAVRIDGTDIREFSLESYRSRMAAVFQDTTLFNDTIRNNLAYVRENVSDVDIRNACKQANILEFVESLEKGLDTEVGERGLKLSGGEKQRLAIARAIIADPDILILDEATSALDAKTERLVQDAFETLMAGRTSIVIAHRLSTIRNADRIFLFEKGRLIGSGNHSELYAASSVYREMVDYQKNGFVEEGPVSEESMQKAA